MKKFFLVVFPLLVAFSSHTLLCVTTLMKHDPYPIYNAASYPYSYLLTRVKNYLKCITDCEGPEYISIAASGYFQKANMGRDFDSQRAFLGDLEGKWHMVGMMYGPVPTVPPGQTLVGKQLGAAKTAIFGVSPDTTIPPESILTDTSERIGWFSVPLKYRKMGVRFEISGQPVQDFGITVQAGFADIKQTLTQFINLGTEAIADGEFDSFSPTQVDLVQAYLMSDTSARAIFEQQGLESCDFKAAGFEDIRLFAWWHHAFQINWACDPCDLCDYAQFLLIPFVQLEGVIPTGRKMDRHKLFALSFGNDGHGSIGFTAGFHFDFYETIEFGFYGGLTHFFPRDISDFRLPTHRTQSGVFPFAAPKVRKSPGMNGNFGLLFHAYHFLECLSFYADYAWIQHHEDKIRLLEGDPAAFTEENIRKAECLTKWSSQVFNTAFYYDISPNMQLGLAVQWPIKQRNAYRSTTVMGTFQLTF